MNYKIQVSDVLSYKKQMRYLFGDYIAGARSLFAHHTGAAHRLRRGIYGPGTKMTERGWPAHLPPEGGD